MTQDERWFKQWITIMDFMEANKWRPSKCVENEKLSYSMVIGCKNSCEIEK